MFLETKYEQTITSTTYAEGFGISFDGNTFVSGGYSGNSGNFKVFQRDEYNEDFVQVYSMSKGGNMRFSQGLCLSGDAKTIITHQNHSTMFFYKRESRDASFKELPTTLSMSYGDLQFHYQSVSYDGTWFVSMQNNNVFRALKYNTESGAYDIHQTVTIVNDEANANYRGNCQACPATGATC